jgi:hypothetical protein
MYIFQLIILPSIVIYLVTSHRTSIRSTGDTPIGRICERPTLNFGKGLGFEVDLGTNERRNLCKVTVTVVSDRHLWLVVPEILDNNSDDCNIITFANNQFKVAYLT